MWKYKLLPETKDDYIRLCTSTCELRKTLAPGLCGVFIPEVGGNLNEVTHFYHYSDYDARDAVRTAMRANGEWQKFLKESMRFVSEQKFAHFHRSGCGDDSGGFESEQLQGYHRE